MQSLIKQKASEQISTQCVGCRHTGATFAFATVCVPHAAVSRLNNWHTGLQWGKNARSGPHYVPNAECEESMAFGNERAGWVCLDLITHNILPGHESFSSARAPTLHADCTGRRLSLHQTKNVNAALPIALTLYNSCISLRDPLHCLQPSPRIPVLSKLQPLHQPAYLQLISHTLSHKYTWIHCGIRTTPFLCLHTTQQGNLAHAF